jgi:2-polyprenyl-3-methyl-5-hydroxy-6-metoxy-1,4-benzoquinol methylase
MSILHQMATRQYSEHYARMNPTLDADRMPQRTYRNMELMYGSIVDQLSRGQSVADLGCGAGFLLHWLAGREGLRLFGVDLSEDQAALARHAAPSAQIFSQDARAFLHGREVSFGGIFCTDMLEHVEGDDELFLLLSDIWKALEHGGFFVCRVPNAAHLLGSYSRYMDITHHRSFTSHSLRQALSATGFADVRFIPTRSSIWRGKLRLGLERLLHRALFLLGGYTMEDTFTQNVIAVALKP